MSKNLINIPKILTIAGSDSGGGAGIQADIKTATALNVYISSIITCLTAQNTKKVTKIHNPPLDFLASQLATVLCDIDFSVIKTGMVGNEDNITVISQNITPYLLEKNVKLVVDPVMVATSGDLLIQHSAINALKELLIAKSYLVTPNIDEAEILANIKISDIETMKKAGNIIKKIGAKNVLIKGGHLACNKQNKDKIHNLLLTEDNNFHIISNKRITMPHNINIINDNKIIDKIEFHGTGCSLATAIGCNIAKNIDIILAVNLANRYIARAIKNNLVVGNGSRVLCHF